MKEASGARAEAGARPSLSLPWAHRVLSLLALAVLALPAPARAEELPEVSAFAPAPAPGSPAALRTPPGWAEQARDDDPERGWVIYTRDVPGSDFEAFRLEAVIDAPPALVAAALRDNIRDPRVSQEHTEKTVLQDRGDVVLVYSYIDMPLVSDRDVVTRSERMPALPDGGHRFEWRATDDGPSPRDGVVRLRESSGSWEFRPLPVDRSFAVYESHTDIGGSIPAWLVNRLMVDTVVDGLVSLRARVADKLAQRAAGEAPRRSTAR